MRQGWRWRSTSALTTSRTNKASTSTLRCPLCLTPRFRKLKHVFQLKALAVFEIPSPLPTFCHFKTPADSSAFPLLNFSFVGLSLLLLGAALFQQLTAAEGGRRHGRGSVCQARVDMSCSSSQQPRTLCRRKIETHTRNEWIAVKFFLSILKSHHRFSSCRSVMSAQRFACSTFKVAPQTLKIHRSRIDTSMHPES